ncbi:MAG: VCBS repeat-containing protein [bacterium]|nr:VCBS repeat-containing protein [bacterium]
MSRYLILTFFCLAALAPSSRGEEPFPGVHLDLGWSKNNEQFHSIQPIEFKDSFEVDFLIHAGQRAVVAWRPGRSVYYLELDDSVSAVLRHEGEDADGALLITSSGLVVARYDPSVPGLVKTDVLMSGWTGVKRLWSDDSTGVLRIFGYDVTNQSLLICDWNGIPSAAPTARPTVMLPEALEDLVVMQFDPSTTEPEVVALFQTVLVVANYDGNVIHDSFTACAEDKIAKSQWSWGGDTLVWATYALGEEPLITMFNEVSGGPVTELGSINIGEMLVFDYDGDGADDVVLSSNEGPEVRVLLDLGIGNLSLYEPYEPIDYDSADPVTAMTHGDYDTDGDEDMVFLRSQGSGGEIYINCSTDQELSRARYLAEENAPRWFGDGELGTMSIGLTNAPLADTDNYLVQHHLQHGLNGVFETTPSDTQFVDLSGETIKIDVHLAYDNTDLPPDIIHYVSITGVDLDGSNPPNILDVYTTRVVRVSPHTPTQEILESAYYPFNPVGGEPENGIGGNNGGRMGGNNGGNGPPP